MEDNNEEEVGWSEPLSRSGSHFFLFPVALPPLAFLGGGGGLEGVRGLLLHPFPLLFLLHLPCLSN